MLEPFKALYVSKPMSSVTSLHGLEHTADDTMIVWQIFSYTRSTRQNKLQLGAQALIVKTPALWAARRGSSTILHKIRMCKMTWCSIFPIHEYCSMKEGDIFFTWFLLCCWWSTLWPLVWTFFWWITFTSHPILFYSRPTLFVHFEISFWLMEYAFIAFKFNKRYKFPTLLLDPSIM